MPQIQIPEVPVDKLKGATRYEEIGGWRWGEENQCMHSLVWSTLLCSKLVIL